MWGIGFIVGVVVGAIFGMIVAALMAANVSDREDSEERGQNDYPGAQEEQKN